MEDIDYDNVEYGNNPPNVSFGSSDYFTDMTRIRSNHPEYMKLYAEGLKAGINRGPEFYLEMIRCKQYRDNYLRGKYDVCFSFKYPIRRLKTIFRFWLGKLLVRDNPAYYCIRGDTFAAGEPIEFIQKDIDELKKTVNMLVDEKTLLRAKVRRLEKKEQPK